MGNVHVGSIAPELRSIVVDVGIIFHYMLNRIIEICSDAIVVAKVCVARAII